VHVSRIVGRRIAAFAATAATTLSLFAAVAPAAHALPSVPPPNPSDKQISAAAQHKTALANQVGVLGGQIAQAQAALVQLEAKRQLAEQKVAYAITELHKAQAAAKKARARVKAATDSAVAAHTKFVQYLQASYMDGGVSGTEGSLLTASDPNALLSQGALAQYQAENKIDAIGTMQRASVVKSNSEAEARRAVQDLDKRANAAKAAENAAADALAAEKVQKATLQSTLQTSQVRLDAAASELATLNNQKAAYNAYAAEKRRLALIAAAKAERERLARIAAQQAAARRQQQHSGGGGGTFSPPPSSGPSAPSGGNWTEPKGRQAANRALSRLGDLYIWAAGSRYGPDDGGCTDPIAPCGTVGFDCSGLVLYAWGASWAHFAASQYYVGSYHPSPGSFKEGDLLFWTGGGSEISHVAIYIGHGNVVQAPQSGDIVKITPWNQVESGYYGATRPLT
jgi:cell wall-associated NlpC family hydrolase